MDTNTERKKSILNGRDNEAIPILLEIHCNTLTPKILDCTHNKGTMWKGLTYDLTTMDIDPQFNTDYVADFRKMPFEDDSFDVIVFDPPHLPIASATEHASKIWETRYGLNDIKGNGRDGDNVSEMFYPFLMEAKRVLKQDGIILAKIADLTHNHRYQWQHVDLINTVRKVGLTPCDMLIKVDPSAGNLQSSKWKNIKHLRKSHCFWIVIRNSNKCECKTVK